MVRVTPGDMEGKEARIWLVDKVSTPPPPRIRWPDRSTSADAAPEFVEDALGQPSAATPVYLRPRHSVDPLTLALSFPRRPARRGKYAC